MKYVNFIFFTGSMAAMLLELNGGLPHFISFLCFAVCYGLLLDVVYDK